jgi:hypothetical protein
MRIHPPDDIFRGARSYEEVLARIRSLAPEDTTSVLKFQEHRRSCLPTVLRGESPGVSETKQKDTEGPKDATPDSENTRTRGNKQRSPKQRHRLRTRQRNRIRKPRQRPLNRQRSRTRSTPQENQRNKSGNPSLLSPPCSRHKEISKKDGYSMRN